jgi:pimeloyl-ACP methyl ester carboxylesterase
MVRLSAFALLLLCLVVPTTMSWAQVTKEVEINGFRTKYVEQGSGEPMVFVHGAPADLRAWEAIREGIASRYRFIAYNQRYFGTEPWPDDGKNFSIPTLADDLATFITSFNAGPVHLVSWSFGGLVAMQVAVKNPSLVRSVILYEPNVISVLSTDSAEGRAAREDRSKMLAPVIAAMKGGDAVQATKLAREAWFQLGPGGFDREPQTAQTRMLDNARTMPLLFGAPPPPAITCDMLKNFPQPTLVMRGEKTQLSNVLISEAISRCVPGAQLVVLQNVNHDGPSRDPAAFTGAIFEFLSRR